MKILFKAILALLLVIGSVLYIDRCVNEIYGNPEPATVQNIFKIYFK